MTIDEAMAEIELLRDTLKLQQRSYEREIELEVAAERERCEQAAGALRNMEAHGDCFAASIARAHAHGTRDQQRRLLAAFPELFADWQPTQEARQ